jgi:hypothetical protein
MMLRLALSLSVVCAACGGDDGGAGVDAGPTCTPLVAAPVGTGTVQNAVPVGDQLAVLLRRDTAMVLATVDAAGAVTEVTVGGGATGGGAVAVDPQGRACVAWVGAQSHVQAACAPTWQATDTGLEAESNSALFLAYETSACATAAGGCVPNPQWVMHFQGGFASASYASSDDGVAWTETDLFISSVTAPTSVTSMTGQIVACVAGNGGATLVTYHPYRGEIDDVQRWGSRGSRCAVVADGRTLHLVSSDDAQLTYVAWDFPYLPSAPWEAPAPLAAQPALAVTSGAPLAAGLIAGQLHVAFVDATGATVEATRAGAEWSVATLSTQRAAAIALATGPGMSATVATLGSATSLWRSCQP